MAPLEPQHLRAERLCSVLRRYSWAQFAFECNATDAHPDLALAGGDGASPYNWTNSTLRPRTYGVMMTYRY